MLVTVVQRMFGFFFVVLFVHRQCSSSDGYGTRHVLLHFVVMSMLGVLLGRMTLVLQYSTHANGKMLVKHDQSKDAELER